METAREKIENAGFEFTEECMVKLINNREKLLEKITELEVISELYKKRVREYRRKWFTMRRELRQSNREATA